jgi:putative salt-induced outer membrane protein
VVRCDDSGVMRSLLGAALVLAPALALSQVPPPPPPTPPPLYSGKAELSFVNTSGNTSTQTLGFGAEGEYKPAPWAVKATLAFVRAESDGETKAKSLAASLRGSRKIADPIEVFAQAAYLKNTFAGIDNRFGLEAGVAYTFLKGPPHLLKFEAALGWTRELRVTEPSLSFATARLGVSYKWAISKTAELTDDSSFIEDLSDAGDWRLQSVTGVSAAMSTLLSLKISYTFAYVRKPPPGFGRTDTITAAALVAKF